MENSWGYFPNYYSIEDIMVTQEKVPCIVETMLHGMGDLDPSSDKTYLDVGQKVELPLWYALQFSTSRGRTIRVEIPDIYKKISKEICEADANVVDLKRMNKHFYELGRYLMRFDRLNSVGPLLFETCRQRCRHLMDLCKANINETTANSRLEQSEIQLFNAGCNTNSIFSKWLLQDCLTIETAEMVTNHRKRKRAAMEL